jgi:RNase P/RNase MRP subunit p30
MYKADASVYYSNSESANRLLEKHAADLGFKSIFRNFLLTTKSQDFERQIAELAKSVRQQASIKIFARVTLALQVNDKVATLIETTVSKLRHNPNIECMCIRPATEAQLLELLANTTYYDLLSVDLSSGNFFQHSNACARAIKSAGVIVELELSQSSRGSNELTNFINQSKLVFPKTGNVILSSGSKSVLELKSPLDLTNWASRILTLKQSAAVVDKLVDNAARRRSLLANYPS